MDLSLTLKIGALAVTAAAVGVPAQARSVARARRAPVPDPAARALAAVPVAVVGLAAAFLGGALVATTGIPSPLLEFQPGASLGLVASRPILAGIGGGLIVAVVVLPLYYIVLRPLLGPEAFRTSEMLRKGMGLPARVAIGGVWEEIVFRWGVLSLVAWTGARVAGSVSSVVEWVATLAAALAFGAAHLPWAAAFGVRPTARAVAVSFLLNGWLGVVAGWLVWHEGIVAAMVAHASVHVMWAGVERFR